MSKKVLVPIADGVEEIEVVTIIDTLRRAGAEVIVAAVNNLQITAARGTKIIADKPLSSCIGDYDLIVLPGGMPGTEYLRDNAQLIDMLKKQRNANKLYAAICAAPVIVLQHHGLLGGLKATCYPGLWNQLKNKSEARVVVDKNCITSQGPGTALEFTIKLIELLFDVEKATQISKSLVM